MRKTMFASVLTVFIVLVLSSTIRAKDDDRKLSVVPETFVGDVGDCGPSYPAGSKIVTSAWLGGMGLPDDGSSPNTPSDDPHDGLLLSKNGPTPDCSAAGAVIKGAKGILVTTTFALGFDALWVALALSALAAIVGGGLVARLTARPFWRGALRQLVLGALAAGLTYLIGLAVGGMAAG